MPRLTNDQLRDELAERGLGLDETGEQAVSSFDDSGVKQTPEQAEAGLHRTLTNALVAGRVPQGEE